MTTFLLILQSLGLLFAAGAVAASLLKSRGFEEIEVPSPIIGAPRKTQRRLTREAKIGVLMVIAGLFVSFSARMIEQSIANTRNFESQQTTSNQLALLQTSVHEVRRLAAQVRTLDVEIVVPLTSTNGVWLPLRDYFAQRAALYEEKWPEGMAEETEGGPSLHLRALAQRADPDVDVKKWMSIQPPIPERYVEWWDGADGKPRIEAKLITDTRPTALASESKLYPIYAFVDAFRSKACQLRFCHDHIGRLADNKIKIDKKSSESEGIDYMFLFDSAGEASHFILFQEFLCANSPRPRDVRVTYSTMSREILLHVRARFPDDNWERLRPTISFSDFSACSMFLLIPAAAEERPSRAKLKLELIVDGNRLRLADVRSIPKLPRSTAGGWVPGAQITEELWSTVPVPPDAWVYRASLPDLNRR